MYICFFYFFFFFVFLLLILFFFFFFFSSRRRHTRSLCDWSSDVCSSDLIGAITVGDRARIGAGSVVVTNVPPYATVVGVHGHIIGYHDPGNDTVVRLPDPEWDRIDDLERRLAALESRATWPLSS